MRLSTLPLILQVNFDCHLYGTEGRDHLRPWGMSKQMKLDQCQYLQWLYSPCLVFFFFLHTMSILAWKIPWMEEPGGLQSMGSLGVGHDWATSLSLFTFMHWRRKCQPTPVFLPGESQGWGSLVGYSPGGCKESDTTEWLSMYTHQKMGLTTLADIYWSFFVGRALWSDHCTHANSGLSFLQDGCSVPLFSRKKVEKKGVEDVLQSWDLIQGSLTPESTL